jgi:hypothetical protein
MLLNECVTKVREEVGRLPLTIAIHNWGASSAQEFLDVLSPFIETGDAIWLAPITEMKRSTPLPELEGVVMLNLNRSLDQKLYDNLLADIVFFPGEDQTEAAHDTHFMRLARAVFVDGRKTQSGAGIVATHALSRNLITYSWNGAESVVEFTGSDSNDQPVVPQEMPATQTPDEIGHHLRTTASHLEKLIQRRSIFRNRLEQIRSNHESSSWNEILVRQANLNHWPQWAVECLPCYVLIESAEDGSKRALVWRYVIACLPDSESYRTVEKLCDDYVHEVHLSVEATRLVEGFAQIFDDCLRPLPHTTEGGFNGTVDYAMQQIEARFPEASEKTRSVREEFNRALLSNG